MLTSSLNHRFGQMWFVGVAGGSGAAGHTLAVPPPSSTRLPSRGEMRLEPALMMELGCGDMPKVFP